MKINFVHHLQSISGSETPGCRPRMLQKPEDFASEAVILLQLEPAITLEAEHVFHAV